MGRGGKQKQWGKDHGAGVHDYQLWRGSWSPRLRAETQGHPWREQGHKDHGAAVIFPAYDAMPHPPRDPKPGNPEQPLQPGRSHGLQELLNSARKAEIKLQKLIRAKDRAADQWEAFQKRLKESFIKEQSRFHKNGMRLDRDIAEATAEQDRAYEAIQQSVLRGRRGSGLVGGQRRRRGMLGPLEILVGSRTKENPWIRLTPDMQQLLLSFGAIPQWAAGAPASGAGACRNAFDIYGTYRPRPPGYCDIAGYEAFPRWNRPDAATAPEGVAVPIEDPSDQEMQEADAKNGPQSPGLGRMG
ncbi:hypothetical protein AK812_SmicGene41701 [Symbiodinium microadriaticum]|uniref:Uncharacterized protein n=1 Tax=Symbiodinium microadriaticum TaxID=2951 RepID=A0A1Q9C5H6_SYMMI|nr:hypothetical protein AK812_SmicGene41701 [Symbiodinium microadriaticum]CAE7394565.1 unnamed protein product [Symbiodinium microadriaticum]CAE7531459.1 unnamed protein product [Symbiodinium sp. KB8]